MRDQLLAADDVWTAVKERADQSGDSNANATLKRSIALLNKLLADTADKCANMVSKSARYFRARIYRDKCSIKQNAIHPLVDID